MNRAEFLRELKESLIDKLPTEQIEDILYDYAEHFDAGLRDGKSEEEVSKELGSPARVAKSLLPEDHRTSETRAQALPYAPLGNRFAAFAVDSVISGLPMMLVSRTAFMLFMSPLAPLLAFAQPIYVGGRPAMLPGLASFFFFILYQPVSLVFWNGQTLGKRLFNLKVVKRDGSSLTSGTALSREILGRTMLNTFTLGIASVVSFLWAIFSEERRTVHDEIGGTRVIVDEK